MIKKEITIDKAFELMLTGEEVLSTTNDFKGLCKRKIKDGIFLYTDKDGDYIKTNINVNELLSQKFFTFREPITVFFKFQSSDISCRQNISQLYFTHSTSTNVLSEVFPLKKKK